jgi:hypothetical protein
VAFDADLEKPPISDPGSEADGVVYSTIDQAPGMRFFRCEPYRATVSTKTCAARWTKAQDARGDLGAALAACRACATGAAHAGRGRVRYSPHYRSGVCPRCGEGGRRIIGGRVCVSDYNRSREMRAGKNARGNVPIELLQRPLHRVEVLVEVDGEARRLVDRETSGLTETLIQVLRTHTGEISFAFAGHRPASAPTAPAYDPADDAGVDPDEDSPGLDGADGWLLTYSRCQACHGRILRSARPPVVHRCADCGTASEGQPEKVPDVGPPTNGEPAADLEVRRREVCRYRARMFATTAHVGGEKAWGRRVGRAADRSARPSGSCAAATSQRKPPPRQDPRRGLRRPA